MQISTYFIAAIWDTLISILAIGVVLVSWMDRLRPRQADKPRPTLLLACAAGLYWNTLVFIVLFFFAVPLKTTLVEMRWLIEAAIVGVSFGLNGTKLRDLGMRIRSDGTTSTFAVAGTMIGVWAMLEFPNVLDSGQILWTQQTLDGGMVKPISAMMGYSALVGPLAALFPASPVVTTAAAFKPLLLGLFGCVSALVGDVIAPRDKVLTTFSFFAICLLSTFGSYGLLELGKDSMWGILFAMAFFATLCRGDAGQRGVEIAVYFVIASTLGVIALPYMIVAYALWLLLSASDEGATATIPVLLLVGLPILPTVFAGFLNTGLALTYLAYVILTATVVICHRAKIVDRVVMALSHPLRPIRAFVPLICAIPAVLLFPAALTFPVWTNVDGSVIFESRAPLDGATSFKEYMLVNPAQDVTIIMGLVALTVVGFTPFGRRSSGLIAIATMPFFVLVAVLIRIHLHIRLISDFNIWDIVKDIPQWFGGTLMVFVLLAALYGLSQFIKKFRVYPFMLLLTVGFCAYEAQHKIPFSYYANPVIYGRFSSYADPDMAKLSNLAWEDFRGHTIWMDPGIAENHRHFYYLQMYGAAPSFYDPAKLDAILDIEPEKVGFVIGNSELIKLKRLVDERSGSIRELGKISNGEGSIVVVELDGKKLDTVPDISDSLLISEGSHDREQVGSRSFSWMKSRSTILATSSKIKTGCISLSLFDPQLIHGPLVVTLTDGQGHEASVDISGRTPVSPAVLKETAHIIDGVVKLNLESAGGEARFPGDLRDIAFGLLLPMKLSDGACGQAPAVP